MSFQIQDKQKLRFFRKCVQLLTAESEQFYMIISDHHIRLAVDYQIHNAQQFFDFECRWFTKFKAPEELKNALMARHDEDDDDDMLVQLEMERDAFLQSFNLNEDTDCEFQLMFSADCERTRHGRLQVIKTREYFVIESYVPFMVSDPANINMSTLYQFPETGLLCGARTETMGKLKSVFGKAKYEIISLEFAPSDLKIRKGATDSEMSMNLSFGCDRFLPGCFGHYTVPDEEEAKEADKPRSFRVRLRLSYMNTVLHICEQMQSTFNMAMELTSAIGTCAKANVFIFTEHDAGEAKGDHIGEDTPREFRHVIGLFGVNFEPMDGSMKQSEQQQMVPTQIINKQVATQRPDDLPMSALENEATRIETKQQKSQMTMLMQPGQAKAAGNSFFESAVPQRAADDDQRDLSQPMLVDQMSSMYGGRPSSDRKMPNESKSSPAKDSDGESSEDEEAKSRAAEARQDFYRRVDAEDFF